MKAIRVRELGAPAVMKVENIEAPPPGRGQVLVRIHAAGVNPVDTYIRSGVYAIKPALPYTPGTDGAGVVQDVGEEVTNVKPGDRVYTASTISGTYAELALCDARQVYPLAEGLTFSQGAGIFVPYATAQRALFQKRGRPS
jgi:NADPH:quinone reductase